ncbi:MAG: hypothetical protein ACKVH0_19865 [Alphaproteobacteria bacterium]
MFGLKKIGCGSLSQHISSVAGSFKREATLDDLTANVDQPVCELGQQSMFESLRQHNGAREIGKIAGERMLPQPSTVVGDYATRETRPLNGVFAFFDPGFTEATNAARARFYPYS